MYLLNGILSMALITFKVFFCANDIGLIILILIKCFEVDLVSVVTNALMDNITSRPQISSQPRPLGPVMGLCLSARRRRCDPLLRRVSSVLCSRVAAQGSQRWSLPHTETDTSWHPALRQWPKWQNVTVSVYPCDNVWTWKLSVSKLGKKILVVDNFHQKRK